MQFRDLKSPRAVAPKDHDIGTPIRATMSRVKTEKRCSEVRREFGNHNLHLHRHPSHYHCVEFGRLGYTRIICTHPCQILAQELDPKFGREIFSFEFRMVVIRAGIDVAVHCKEPLLHAAAFSSFEVYIHGLLEQGRMSDAITLWDSVVEIQHLPIPDEPLLSPIRGLPPMRKSVCCEVGCLRCEQRRGGYRFLWVGVWTRRFAVVWPGAPAVEAWQSFGANSDNMELLQLHMVASDRKAADFCPDPWHTAMQLTSKCLGCASMADLVAQWRIWQLGSEVWIDTDVEAQVELLDRMAPARRHARRALAGWLAFARVRPEDCLPKACRGCGTPSRCICASCHESFCRTCLDSPWRPACCEEDEGGDALHFEVPALQPGQRDAHLFQQLVRQAQGGAGLDGSHSAGFGPFMQQ